MVAGKGLILKSLLGVSAVGGGVTVVAVGHKKGWLSTLGTTTTDAGQGGGGGGVQSGVGAGTPGATGSGAQVSQVSQSGDDDQAETNNKLTPLGLPEKCKFSSGKKDKVDCDVSKEDLVKIAFKDKDDSADLTIETGQDDFTGMKLEVKKLGEEEKKHYDSSPEFIFTFKDFDKTVTLKKDTTEVVKLVKGTDPVFKKTDDNKLERIWKEEGSFCQKVGITYSDNNAKITKDSEIPFLEGDQIKKYKLKDTSADVSDKITVTKDSEGYNQGFKFSTTGDVEFKNSDNTEISGDDAKKLKASKDYQILFKDGANGGWYLVEKT